DPVAQLKCKEIKRAALNELIDHITSTKGAIVERSSKWSSKTYSI
uniref:Uncharacterized protein n=1 Tax=Caenorhabditis japonica TaxID=281687 RepID=A0A8R1DKT8_CAEJA